MVYYLSSDISMRLALFLILLVAISSKSMTHEAESKLACCPTGMVFDHRML